MNIWKISAGLMLHLEINIDYILNLVKKQQKDGDVSDKEFNISIEKAVNSSVSLRFYT